MVTVYARIINYNQFNYHILFSASFCKINEEDQRSDESEFFKKFSNIQNLTECDLNNIDLKSQLKQQLQIQETKESRWIFDKMKSMNKMFHKIGELNGSKLVEIPVRSNGILTIEII